MSQISLYEGTWELAEACAALLTKCDVPLEDQLDVSRHSFISNLVILVRYDGELILK